MDCPFRINGLEVIIVNSSPLNLILVATLKSGRGPQNRSVIVTEAFGASSVEFIPERVNFEAKLNQQFSTVQSLVIGFCQSSSPITSL